VEPYIYHVKLMTFIQKLKKATSISVSSYCLTLEFLCYRIERKLGVVLQPKLATHNEQMSNCPNCHVSVCSKFCQLCFCQIWFELVYSWKSYRKNKKVNFFVTLCTSGITKFLVQHIVIDISWHRTSLVGGAGRPVKMATPLPLSRS